MQGGILACDFFVAVTATFRMLYVFVVIEHGTRRLAHVNVTTHPSAAWTLQQLREVIADADQHKYLIHDRDSIFARHLDDSIRAQNLDVDGRRLRSCERNPCSVACTTSTPSRRRRRSRHGIRALNPMTESAEVLKSGVAPAGRHFCGARPQIPHAATAMLAPVSAASRSISGDSSLMGSRHCNFARP
jgi:hypothetical protein